MHKIIFESTIRFIIYLALIEAIWVSLELLILKEVRPNIIDTIMGTIWAISLVFLKLSPISEIKKLRRIKNVRND